MRRKGRGVPAEVFEDVVFMCLSCFPGDLRPEEWCCDACRDYHDGECEGVGLVGDQVINCMLGKVRKV